jgi:hypothetical protein
VADSGEKWGRSLNSATMQKTKSKDGGTIALPSTLESRTQIRMLSSTLEGQLCGIKDEFGHELEFPAAFRKSRYSHRPRGIVKIGDGL